MKNVHLEALEHRDSIIFMHQIKEGPANKSFGLQVAKLAGVPPSVINVAKEKLRTLENQIETTEVIIEANVGEDFVPDTPSVQIAKEIAELDVDSLTPKDALNLLYKLKNVLD